MSEREVLLPTLASTQAFARKLAPWLKAGDVLALYGDLGAGKTTFARALLGELGVTDDVPSPTFTLVQVYEGPAFPIYHFDLYRLKQPQEVEEIGWDEACAQALTLVEWPERAGPFLPRNRLRLLFEVDPQGSRRIVARLEGAMREDLMQAFS